MAERLAYLEAVVGADITQFRKGMRDIRNETGILSETIHGLGALGRTMTFTLTAPLVALSSAAVKVAGDFDGAMRNINSIAQLSEDEFIQLKERVLDLGSTLRSGPQALAESLYEVYSAGLVGEAAFDIARESAYLAESGLSDLKSTTNALTATMLTYGSTGLKAADASNIWARMVQLGVGSLEEFLSNSQKVLPLGRALNISFEDMGATLAFLSQQGGGARKAETALAMAMSNLLKPNETLLGQFKKMGVATGPEFIARFNNLGEAIKYLRDNMSEGDFFKSFSKTGLEAALALTNNYEKFQNTMQQFTEGLDTATLSAWEQQMQSFPAQFELMTSALHGLAITIGTTLIPMITPIISFFREFFLQLSQVNPELMRLGVVFGVVLAAVGPVLWILSSLLTPVGLLIAGASALFTAISTNFGGIRDTIERVVSDIFGDLQPLIDTFKDFWNILFPPEQKPEDILSNYVKETKISNEDIITVDKPTSLWDIFVKRGHDPSQWNDFQKRAKEGGWKGGPINPEDVINLGGNPAEILKKEFLPGYKETMDELKMEGMSTIPTPDIFARLQLAIETVWPRLKTELDNVITNLRNWVGEKTAEVLDILAGLFQPSEEGGDTPVYRAFKKLLDFDVLGALKEIFPNFGDEVAKFFNQVDLQPGETAAISAFQRLLNKVGLWLETNALPTIARSLGYLVGKIGITLGEGIAGLWDSVFGGKATQAVGGVIETVTNSVIDPFTQGLQDAMAEANVTNPIDRLLTTIAGAIGAAALVAGVWTAATNGIVAGIAKALLVAKIGGLAFSGFALRLATTIGEFLLTKLPTVLLATKVGQFLQNAVLEAQTGGFLKFISSSIGNLINSAIAAHPILLNPISLGIVIGTLLYLVIPEEVKESIRTAWEGLIDTIFGEGMWDKAQRSLEDAAYIAIGDIVGIFDKDKGRKIKSLASFWGEIYSEEDAKTAVEDAVTAATSEIQKIQIKPNMLDINMEGSDVTFSTEGFTPVIPFADMFTVQPTGTVAIDTSTGEITLLGLGQNLELPGQMILTPSDSTEFYVDSSGRKFKVFFSDPVTMDSTMTIEPTDIEVPPIVLPEIDVYPTDISVSPPAMDEPLYGFGVDVYKQIQAQNTEANQAIDEGLTTFGATVLQHIGEGTDLDAQAIIDNFLTPLETAWNTTFSATSPMATNFIAFKDTVTNSIDDIPPKLNELQSSFTNTFSTIALGLSTKAMILTTSLYLVQQAVTDLKNEIIRLLKLDPTFTLDVNVTSTVGDVGWKGHQTGLLKVPYDDYPAMLHKGERVLTAAEAKEYDRLPLAIISELRDTRTGDINNNQIIIQGAQDVDGILRELKRRGIYL